MALTILNNIAAIAAENQLNITSNSLNSTLEQLSSGSRINSGADDPAGLAIANGLQANIAALTQSSSNATDGVGELQVADGALSQVTTLLNRAVTLATESATGTVSNTQRQALDSEYQSIKAEIDSIGSTTNYNGGQVFTNNTLNVFLSDGSTSGSSNIGVSTGTLSSTSLTLAGTQATDTLAQQVGTGGVAPSATATLTGGAFIGSTQANSVLTAGTNFLPLTAATATLTGGAFTDATNSTTTLTVGTLTAGDSITIGTSVYTIVASGANATSAGDVALQAGGAAASLTQLAAAINAGTTAGSNTTYDLPTNTQTAVTATVSGSNLVLTSNVAGTSLNTTATTTTGGHETFSSATLGGGGAGATVGVAGSTVDVAGTTYTFVNALSTTPTANEVVGAGGEATALANLVLAVNGSAGAGTNYGTGTVTNANASAGAVGNSNTTITFTAKSPAIGNSYGNSLVSTTSGVGSFTGSTFSGGQAASTVDVAGQTYTFVSALTGTAGQVLIGSSGTNAANITASLLNLANAVNGGTGSGSTYAAGTTVNPNATATAGATTDTFTANVNGTGGNALVSTTANTTNSFNNTTFANGTTGDTVTIGSQTYNFVTALSTTPTANEVLVGGTVASDLTNLASAVNGTAGAGTTYGTGTATNASASVVAGATTATFTAKTGGTAGNSIAATLTGGVGAFTTSTGTPTTTFSGGSAALVAGGPAAAGDTVSIGGKTYTFVSAITATSAANSVLVGATNQSLTSEQLSLQNLAAAVNGATGAGVTYALGTTANTEVTAAATPASAPTSVVFTATTGGVTGNTITATTTGGNNTFSSALLTGGGTATNDLLSSADATAALTLINNAVATVAALRGNIGGTVNRLQAASNVINNQVQNLTAAENNVTAADIPTAVANLTQYSILEQTGISALAQANQQQQLVLKLLT